MSIRDYAISASRLTGVANALHSFIYCSGMERTVAPLIGRDEFRPRGLIEQVLQDPSYRERAT